MSVPRVLVQTFLAKLMGIWRRRAAHHSKHLLDLIGQFPRVNPSPSDPAFAALDIPKLFRQIRSRYKALCSTLGVRPSLRAAAAAETSPPPPAVKDNMQPEEVGAMEVGSVWKLESQPKKPLGPNLDF